ncbi:unnamed protein product [Schistosoma guineensis]|nr:unnamed protein product [Schistosoma guineensis]
MTPVLRRIPALRRRLYCSLILFGVGALPYLLMVVLTNLSRSCLCFLPWVVLRS